MNETQIAPNGTTTQALTLTPQQERAFALREEISQDATPRAIVPRSLAEAKAFADMMAHSSLIPDALKNRAADITMILLAGAELGIPPIKSLSLFHVIEGVPKLSADGKAAIVSASHLCEYLEPREQSNERVVWAAKKKGRPEVLLAYTDEDVKRANLDRPTRSGAPSNHVKFPRAMKNARCKSELANLVWPELVAGIVTAEEARDIIHMREFESPQISAPPPQALPTPPPPAKATAKTSAPAKDKSKPIEASATEKPTTASAPAPSSSAGSSSSTPSASPSDSSSRSGGGLPPDPARDAALSAARDNARALEEARALREGEAGGNDHDPTVPPPNMEDRSPTPTTDAVDQGAGSPASDEEGFGGDEVPEFTIKGFEKEVADAVKDRSVDALKAAKAKYLAWSKTDAGRPFAHRMRDAYSKASADLGVR